MSFKEKYKKYKNLYNNLKYGGSDYDIDNIVFNDYQTLDEAREMYEHFVLEHTQVISKLQELVGKGYHSQVPLVNHLRLKLFYLNGLLEYYNSVKTFQGYDQRSINDVSGDPKFYLIPLIYNNQRNLKKLKEEHQQLMKKIDILDAEVVGCISDIDELNDHDKDRWDQLNRLEQKLKEEHQQQTEKIDILHEEVTEYINENIEALDSLTDNNIKDLKKTIEHQSKIIGQQSKTIEKQGNEIDLIHQKLNTIILSSDNKYPKKYKNPFDS